MAIDPNKISEFALKFKNYDPHIYEQFIKVLNDYTHDVTVAVTQAPASDILVIQGRAQQMMKVLQLFSEVREPKQKPTP